MLDDALAAASPEHAAAVERWRPEAVVWPLIDLLDDLPDDEVFASLRHYLEQPGRRYALAAKLARLFHACDRERPELVSGWPDGRDEVSADLRWQPDLWRRLRASRGASPAELHAPAIEALRDGHDPVPGRISIYGLTRLTRSRLDVLAALAERQDVHLFLNHPGAALWDKVIAKSGTGRRAATGAERLEHPLLVSLSRDVREFQQRLVTAVPALRTTSHGRAGGRGHPPATAPAGPRP